MKKSKYLFSFVMPVYKVEAYLAETVESILNQTIGFKDNCEIIFINDGSPDNSEEICLKYRDKYPDNIKYIKQSNQGLSAARNRGIEEIEGKYVSFLDSDDIITPDTLESVYSFFEANFDEIDMISIKMNFFEKMTGPHPLNYKFTSNRLIDIEFEYQSIQLSAASSFFKASIFEEYLFDKKIRKFAEDAKFITELLQNKKKYGVVAKPSYLYRKRNSNDSIVNSSHDDPYWYIGTPKDVYRYLFDNFRDDKNKVPRYIQYLVMYELQWRIKQQDQNVLSETELAAYKEQVYSLVKLIDDDIIFSQKNIHSEYKIFLILKKYGDSARDSIRYSDKKFFIGTQRIYDYNWDFKFNVELCEIENDTLTIDGSLWAMLMPGVTFEFWADGRCYEPESFKRSDRDKMFLGESVLEGTGYKVSIPVVEGMNIKAVFKYNGEIINYAEFVTSLHSRLIDSIDDSYRCTNGYMICLPNRRAMCIIRGTRMRRFIHESKFMLKSITKINMPMSIILYRIITILLRAFKSREVWIISDRLDAAGDNGEALLRYIRGNEDNKRIRYYYSIRKSSPDYKKIKAIGKVINQDSALYKILFLQADKIISSHADRHVYNPFGQYERFVRDLFYSDFIFLQHGIIHNDLSRWLNKYQKNIKLFITSAKLEYNSILEGGYGYSSKVVKLTGMPRYDLLMDNRENKIILAPTWRHNLVSVSEEGEKIYNPEFKNSMYYKFYNDLLNDRGISDALKRTGGTMEFYLHPAHRMHIEDFNTVAPVRKAEFPYDYRKAFSEGGLLVTDYSSVAFDFAYMKKPVLYIQHDSELFFAEHMHDRGYFSHKEDGFGPVTSYYEETVSKILEYINNGYRMEDKYRSRVERFFTYMDHENSSRVYHEIEQMGE